MDLSLEKTKDPTVLKLELCWQLCESHKQNRGGIVHKGKHSDLLHRIHDNIWKLISIRWVKAHLNKSKVTAAGVSYDDWYGNDQTDEQAKAGAGKHGYTKGQQFAIEQKVRLVARIQHHVMNTYINYIKNLLVKEDAEKHKNMKGTKTGAVGRPSVLPEQLGHDVKLCGEHEYCLGCGRSTKAKHIDTAKH
eukprot:12545429-Heterocapsa_arctica.AAC.1